MFMLTTNGAGALCPSKKTVAYQAATTQAFLLYTCVKLGVSQDGYCKDETPRPET